MNKFTEDANMKNSMAWGRKRVDDDSLLSPNNGKIKLTCETTYSNMPQWNYKLDKPGENI